MRLDQWKKFRRVVDKKETSALALIIDSPWIPGFLGISHLDYYLYPDLWLKANLQVLDRFPNIIFVPGFWVEYGMAVELSGFGSKIEWYNNSTPVPHPVITSVDEIARLKVPNPEKDGLMPFVLHLYQCIEKKINSTPYVIKMVAARGPLAIASWIYGVTNLMLGIKRHPQEVKLLLEITTETTIKWLKAQIGALSAVESVMVLDDIVGFLSPIDYNEFAHPFLKAIFAEFKDYIKIYHNDSNTTAILAQLANAGFDVFNFSHEVDIARARTEMGEHICLMGNIPPLDVLSRGSPKDVMKSAEELLSSVPKHSRLILSAGGGVAPGTPAENIDALIKAYQSYQEMNR